MVLRRSVATPTKGAKTVEERLHFDGEDVSLNDFAVSVSYREATGSLMYFMTATKPNVVHAVSSFS